MEIHRRVGAFSRKEEITLPRNILHTRKSYDGTARRGKRLQHEDAYYADHKAEFVFQRKVRQKRFQAAERKARGLRLRKVSYEVHREERRKTCLLP